MSYTLRPERIGGSARLCEQAIVAPEAATFPNGCHVCEVEIDLQTGEYEITRYSVVDDVGRLINPMLVKGHIHGGIAQGIGQILARIFAMTKAASFCQGLSWITGCRGRRMCRRLLCTATRFRRRRIRRGQGVGEAGRGRRAGGGDQCAGRCAGRAGHRAY